MFLRLPIILIFFAFFGSATAQHDDCYDFKDRVIQQELGLSFYSMTELPTSIYHYSVNHDLSFRRGYVHSFIHGLMYKRVVNYKHAFRGGFGYATAFDDSEHETDRFTFRNFSAFNGVNLRLGYQYNIYHWRAKNLTVYASTDLLGGLGNHKGKEMVLTDGDTLYNRAYNTRIKEFGISPSLGLYYHINSEWSFSLESGVNYVRYRHVDQAFMRTDHALQFEPVRALSIHYWF